MSSWVTHNTSCKYCGATGTVRFRARGSKAQVDDRIGHEDSCRLKKAVQPRHLKQKGWRKQERRANALVGARETLASGAVNMDGDGRVLNGWRVEAKQTRTEAYVLTQAVWEKLVIGALKTGEEPMFHVEFPSGGTAIRRVIVRRVLLEVLEEDPCEGRDPKQPLRKKTYKVTPVNFGHTYEVPLDPPGAAIDEVTFQRIKEVLDGHGP